MSISSKMAKIMGWVESLPTKLYWMDKEGKIQFRIAGKYKIGNIWEPEHRIDQTMMIVHKLMTENPSLHLKLDISLEKTVVQFIDYGYAVIFDENFEADTPQMAICIAAGSLEKLEDNFNETK